MSRGRSIRPPSSSLWIASDRVSPPCPRPSSWHGRSRFHCGSWRLCPRSKRITGDQAAAARLLPSGARVAFDAAAEEMADLLQELRQRLRETAPDLEVTAEVARGDPAQVMAARTRDRRAILALATHGRAGLDALWEGSTGGLTIARSEGPFLLVHPEPADSTLAP